MTDRELLELSARSIGLDGAFEDKKEMIRDFVFERRFGVRTKTGRLWNPLEDDGDALRLAVKLGMNIDVGVNPVGFTATAVIADYNSVFVDEYHNEDPMTATRRAIVRAAAAIGEAM